MKKHFLIALLACIVSAQGLSAQSYGIFNHMGIGVGIDLPEGFYAQVAFPITHRFQIRAGATFFPSLYTYRTTANFGTFTINGTPRNADNVNISATTSYISGDLMFDYFPITNKSFHITAGLSAPGAKLVTGSADLSKVLLPSEYGSAFVELEEGNRDSRVSTDEKGFLNVDFVFKSPVRPYIGVGWGRGVSLDHRVSVSVDLGAQYVGGLQASIKNINGDNYVLTSAALENKDNNIVDRIGSFPVLPVLKVGVNVRLF